jgi:hypothetical protein
MTTTRVLRSGVRFDCEHCGKLLRDCGEHHPAEPKQCPCGAELRIVGIGNGMVQHAVWLRCLGCKKLWMRRRGEVVETKPRLGFEQFS